MVSRAEQIARVMPSFPPGIPSPPTSDSCEVEVPPYYVSLHVRARVSARGIVNSSTRAHTAARARARARAPARAVKGRAVRVIILYSETYSSDWKPLGWGHSCARTTRRTPYGHACHPASARVPCFGMQRGSRPALARRALRGRPRSSAAKARLQTIHDRNMIQRGTPPATPGLKNKLK